MEYDIVNHMIKLKQSGNSLVDALTELFNAIATTKLPNLEHFLATLVLPVAKKDGSALPVGIEDVFRRIALNTIDCYHHQKITDACKFQYGNGVRLGNEAIVHTIRETLKDGSKLLMTVDASNAFNMIRRSKALKSIHDRVPEL